MSDHVFNVLFLCTQNSARSIIAEALLNGHGEGRFHAYSAGSEPRGAIHPHVLDLLTQRGYDISRLRSKSWSEFAGPDAPVMDFVFTVCDAVAEETCPVWPGKPLTANWGLPDPAAVGGTEAERRFAFADTLRMLRQRITIFASLPLTRLERLALQTRLDEIGRDEASTPI